MEVRPSSEAWVNVTKGGERLTETWRLPEAAAIISSDLIKRKSQNFVSETNAVPRDYQGRAKVREQEGVFTLALDRIIG